MQPLIVYTAAQEIALGFLSEEEFIGLSCQSLARIVSMENCAYVYKTKINIYANSVQCTWYT